METMAFRIGKGMVVVTNNVIKSDIFAASETTRRRTSYSRVSYANVDGSRNNKYMYVIKSIVSMTKQLDGVILLEKLLTSPYIISFNRHMN